ncbi:SufE-like protein 1, chloroplastic/mitochondrial [Ancistrocladus abbreviatus]
MSISSSLRIITTKLPQFLIPNCLLSQTLISALPQQLKLPCSLSVINSISFQRLTTKPQAMSSSSPSPSSSSSLQSIEELPPKLQEIVNLFQSVQEPKAKYEQLLFYGRNLSRLDDMFKTKENKVEGCVSQVWVRAYLDPQKNVWYEADSDSVLTKGLAALLVQGLSGRPVTEILQVSPDFVTLLGLQQSLTPSRNNGFLNMLKLMQKKALILAMEAEKLENGLNTQLDNENLGLGPNINDESRSASIESSNSVNVGGEAPIWGDSDSGGGLGSRGQRIREKLEKELKPIELEVEDISYQHAGHAGVRGSDGETHFNLRVVSEDFEGKSLVKRHRMVYALLQDELQSGLHALSIIAKTPSEVDGR